MVLPHLRAIGRLAAAAAAISLLALGRPAGAAAAGFSPEYFLERGMPVAARNAFLALPAASRSAAPVLPLLIRRLGEGGRQDLALSLFEEVRPILSEPVRSDAFFEAGRILFDRKEYGKASEAFRQVSGKSGSALQAAFYRARIHVSTGDAAAAAKALSAAPDGGKKSLLAGSIEMARRNPEAAAAAWGRAMPGTDAGFSARLFFLSRTGGEEGRAILKSLADNAASGPFPRGAAARKAYAYALLEGGDNAGALSAAGDSLGVIARWKAAAGKIPGWNGTRQGASESWRTLASLFPYDADASRFLFSGRIFLASAALQETLRETQTEDRAIARRAAAAAAETAAREKGSEASAARVETIRRELLARKRKAEEARDRLREAADSFPVASWGSGNDPDNAARIEEAEKRIRTIGERAARIRRSAEERSRSGSFPAQERRMLFHAQQRAAKIEDRLIALEGETAFLRLKTWNRWKSEYLARISRTLGVAEAAARAAGEAAERANRISLPVREGRESWSSLRRFLERIRNKLDANDRALEGMRAAAGAEASRRFAEAVQELRSAVALEERGTRYLAARAATESGIEEMEKPPGGRSLSPDRLAVLRKEAIGHWEALLPPGGTRDGLTDEVLYALAELRFQEEDSRFYNREEESRRSGGKKVEASLPDHAASRELFRKVAEGFPESPYAEQAQYGLALSLQEGGDAEEAAAAMKTFLARYPKSLRADEINLRLGEHSFDRYEFREAEEAYRKVSGNAPPEIRATALFKLGWSLFLQERPREAVDPFLSSLLLSPASEKNAGVGQESLVMTARSLVEARMEREAESLLARRGASSRGPALLLQVQRLLDAQDRYVEAAEAADRIGKAYPTAPERLDAEVAAAEALRKAGKEEESWKRRANFHLVLGPGSAWRACPTRAPGEAARADAVSEEGLRSAAYRFHDLSRRSPPGDRAAILALYDAHRSKFPASAGAGEVAYQRAWLLFEDGRKGDAKSAFEEVALRRGGNRGEASRYMAVQCAKDLSSVSDAASQAEVVRLCGEYERFEPKGDRLRSVLLDRARAHLNLRQFGDAARFSDRAAALAADPGQRRAALRISGDARFEEENFEAAEKAFRAFLSSCPPAAEAKEVEKWIGFSMFRRAEKMPPERSAEAALLFARVAAEFPSHEIASTAGFRSGEAYAAAGRNADAIAAFLPLESAAGDPDRSLDSTRWLARLYERSGDPVSAAVRYERIARAAGIDPGEKAGIFLKAADLFSEGKDQPRARKNLLAAASLPGAPADLRVQSLFRAGESERIEGNVEEADRRYREAVAANGPAPGADPVIAGKALFRMAEYRFDRYRKLAIVPPLEKTFEAKQAALGECGKLYTGAIESGDFETVSASLHRLGEAFEDFRSAILASPPPSRLSDREREEYVFLLEDKAAPIEENAVEVYRKNLRQGLASDSWNEWTEKSFRKLKELRPGFFVKKGEYSFPVVTVPDFRGMIERSAP